MAEGLEQGRAESERGAEENENGPETWSTGQKQAGSEPSTSLKATNAPQDTRPTRTRSVKTTNYETHHKRAPELRKELEPNRTLTEEPEERLRPSNDDKEKRKPAKEQDSKDDG